MDVGGRSVGVFNIGGEFFALINRCPHQAGPLCKGRLSGFLRAAEPGEYVYSRAGEILRCPWHGWEFDVRTCESWFDPDQVRVRRYEVAVESRAQASPAVRPVGDPPPMAGLQPGPYVAETFPVSVERQYIIVEVGR